MSTVLDWAGAVLMVIGAVLALTAAIGLLRLPDVLSRMHAATKPQVLGVVLLAVGAALHLRTSVDTWMLVLTAVFQVITAPVTAHLVGRLAHRTGGVRPDLLHVDELADHPGHAAADPTRPETSRRGPPGAP
jgi:multicomponent Na+:H+ antiporter subunit G